MSLVKRTVNVKNVAHTNHLLWMSNHFFFSRLYVSNSEAEDICRDIWGVPAEVANIEFYEEGSQNNIANDQKKDECVLEDSYVLVSDAPIENILNIENVLKPVIQDNKRLLIRCLNN